MGILEAVRMALKRNTEAYDEELREMIDAAVFDLQLTDIDIAEESDPLVRRAIITYVCMNQTFVDPGDYTRLKASYDEQKAQLSMSSRYTRW